LVTDLWQTGGHRDLNDILTVAAILPYIRQHLPNNVDKTKTAPLVELLAYKTGCRNFWSDMDKRNIIESPRSSPTDARIWQQIHKQEELGFSRRSKCVKTMTRKAEANVLPWSFSVENRIAKHAYPTVSPAYNVRISFGIQLHPVCLGARAIIQEIGEKTKMVNTFSPPT